MSGGRISFQDARERVRRGEAIDDAVAAFVAGLTTEEKLWCLDGDEDFWPGLRRMAGAGIARVAGHGSAGQPYYGAALPELHFPGIAFSDGPRGVVLGNGTCFPVSMARGATWDPGLEERIGDAIGRELRARGATLFGGVCVNLLRHPAWGRAQETYGEDPHHVGEMGAALTRGVQRHAMACVKHYALNSMENARFKVDVSADDRTLHEVYLPHFKRIVDEGIACVMSAYNSVNGAWCGENHQLLTDILRDEWSFEGFVISDWIFGLRDPVKSVIAGLDIEMPFRQQRMQHVPTALAKGQLTDADITAPITHLASTLLRFDSVLSRQQPDQSVVACDEHRALAYEAAVKSIVLLKNDLNGAPLLPLDAGALKRVAVLGRLAATANLGDRGSSNVVPPSVVTPLDGLRAALPGVEVVQDDGSDLDRAGQLTHNADAVVVVVGWTYEDEGEYITAQGDLLMSHAPPRPDTPPREQRPPRAERRERPPTSAARTFATGGDRESLALSDADQALVRAAAQSNERTVVILMGGSAIMVEGWHEAVPAILMLWYPGMEGGRALADILLGRANPSGRLPFAVPTDDAHLVPFDREAEHVTYGLFHGQWLLDRDGHAPRYPFGFGLSFAEVRLRDVTVEMQNGAIVAEATLDNDSDLPTSEVVQVYAGKRSPGVARALWRLIGFARVELEPKTSARAHLGISTDQLAVRVTGTWRVEPGRYEIAVGLHARDPEATTVQIVIG